MTAHIQELHEVLSVRRRRYEIAKMSFIVITTLTTLMITGILLTGVAKLQQVTASTNTNSKILIDCTQPGGNCYEDGNRRTGTAVGTINQVSIFAAYCSKLPENNTVAEIQSCIQIELDKVSHR